MIDGASPQGLTITPFGKQTIPSNLHLTSDTVGSYSTVGAMDSETKQRILLTKIWTLFLNATNNFR